MDHPTLTTRTTEDDFERERKEVWGNAEDAVAAGVNVEIPPFPAPNDDEVANNTSYSYSTGRKRLLPQDLNTESGLAGSLIEDIMIERNIVQFRGRIKKRMVEHDDGKAAFDTTRKGWKLTGGELVKHNMHRLGKTTLELSEFAHSRTKSKDLTDKVMKYRKYDKKRTACNKVFFLGLTSDVARS